MPSYLRFGRYRFRFYSADCQEPRHVHVYGGDDTAKIWLDPVATVAKNRGIRAHEMNRILGYLNEHAQEFRDEWDRFCSDGN